MPELTTHCGPKKKNAKSPENRGWCDATSQHVDTVHQRFISRILSTFCQGNQTSNYKRIDPIFIQNNEIMTLKQTNGRETTLDICNELSAKTQTSQTFQIRHQIF
jgi:hypothetical protein